MENAVETQPPSEQKPEIIKITQKDLIDLNTELLDLNPEQRIQWAFEVFGQQLAILTAFQEAGCLLASLCYRFLKTLPEEKRTFLDMVFVDTGVNFPQTQDVVDYYAKKAYLKLVRLEPKRTMAQQCAEEGVLYLTVEGADKCCYLRKIEPLDQIKGRYSALLASLHLGGRRKNIPVLQVDERLGVLRIHPFAVWKKETILEYIKELNEKSTREDDRVVINALHAQGYPTVSCTHCTTPVAPGEHERDGRWRHLGDAKKVCKINPADRGEIAGEIAVPADLRARIFDENILAHVRG